MAQGRGNALATPMLLIIFTLQCCCLWHPASAATHTVGDSSGWDVNVDYSSWAASQTFKLGDILFFPYSQAQHNVVVVGKAGYDGCSDANAVATFSEGNTNVTLSSAGTHYYLCSVVGHCSAGMKLAVTVTAAAAPVPAASPPVTAPPPSKTPTPTPSSPPVTAPSTAPSSKSTPASTPSPSPSPPAPAPSAEAPASGPTPSSVPAPVPSVAPTAPSPGAPGAPGAPGSTPSSTAGPPTPPPPNAAPSLLASAATAPLVALWAVLFV